MPVERADEHPYRQHTSGDGPDPAQPPSPPGGITAPGQRGEHPEQRGRPSARSQAEKRAGRQRVRKRKAVLPRPENPGQARGKCKKLQRLLQHRKFIHGRGRIKRGDQAGRQSGAPSSPEPERGIGGQHGRRRSAQQLNHRQRLHQMLRAAAEADRGNQNPVKGKKRPDRSGIPRAVPQQRLHVQPRNQMEIAQRRGEPADEQHSPHRQRRRGDDAERPPLPPGGKPAGWGIVRLL